MNAGCGGRSGALCVRCLLACVCAFIMPVLFLYVLYVVYNASVSMGGGEMSIFCICNVYLSQLGAIIVFNVYLPVKCGESSFEKRQGFTSYMWSLQWPEVRKLEKKKSLMLIIV